MTWRDLIQKPETKIFPWLGETELIDADHCVWQITGRHPEEFGWHRFSVLGRRAKWVGEFDPSPEILIHKECGYLVGNRFVWDDQVRVQDLALFPEVHLIEEGLERFSRISVGRVHENGPLIFNSLEMPTGPEEEVRSAFLDQKASVDDVPGVIPALAAAFRLETRQRIEAERRRAEEERLQRLEQERLEREERRRQLVERLGDGAGRREMAREDFGSAARAALAVGGAELLDHRRSHQRGEMVLTFRLDRQRFECTCREDNLRVIDAGICLTAHYDDPDFEYGTKGDTWLTLESLPGVIREAIREGKLVVFRHA